MSLGVRQCPLSVRQCPLSVPACLCQIPHWCLQIFQQYRPEKGAKLFFFDLDHDIAGGMSPNKGENQDSKKELHLDDKDSSHWLAPGQPFKFTLTSVPLLTLD